MADSSKNKVGIGLAISFLAAAIFAGVLLGGAVSTCFWGMLDGCELELNTNDSQVSKKPKKKVRLKESGKVDVGSLTFDSDLREKDLRKFDLSNLDLSEADLREADLRDAKLVETNLHEADLRKADLRLADLTNADLGQARLNGADFRQANLTGANFENNNTIGTADFRGAWAWASERPTGLVGRAPISLCEEELREDHEGDEKKGKPKGC